MNCNFPALRNVLIGATALMLLALPAAAQEDAPRQEATRAFLITINSDEGIVQGTAMNLATTLTRQEEEVRILLCGDAGDLALEENIPPTLRPSEISPKEMMLEAMSLGATVQVCELYLPNSGFRQYTAEDLVEGVTQASADELSRFMLRPGVRTFSY